MGLFNRTQGRRRPEAPVIATQLSISYSYAMVGYATAAGLAVFSGIIVAVNAFTPLTFGGEMRA
jgi:hypothetical protein